MFDGLKNSLAVRAQITNWRKNVIGQLDNENDQRKDNVDESDLPELVQVVIGGTVSLGATSSHVMTQQQYEVQINSGSFAVSGLKGLNALQFAVYCALLEMQFGTTFNDLMWAGEKFAKDVVVGSVTSNESNVIANRGINGWTSVVGVAVTMYLPRQAMLTYNSSGEMP